MKSVINTRTNRPTVAIFTKKRWILLIIGVLILLATAEVVFGQTNEGMITYETKINMHRTLPKEREEMKKMIPEFRVSQQQLFFNADESLYKPVEEDEDENMEQDGGGIQMRIQQPFVEIYFNRSNFTTRHATRVSWKRIPYRRFPCSFRPGNLVQKQRK